MTETFFPCVFRLDAVDTYVIWYSDDRDGLVRDDGRVVAFRSLAELRAYADRRGLELQPAGVATYDWDGILQWCDDPVASRIAVASFLDAWNMILDTRPTGAEP